MLSLDKWGEIPSGVKHHSSAIRVKIFELSESDDARIILKAFQPAPSIEKPYMLAIWPSREAYDTGDAKRLRGKPGKMFKRMFPNSTPQDIEKFANWYSEKFASVEYTLHVAKDADSFELAYSGEQAEYKNPSTTNARKSLASSCMRHDFSFDHPSRAYASGDFEIVYLTDSSDRIAGRCVVCISDGIVAGPVYGVSESAIDQIESHLNARSATMFDCGGSWEGATLVRSEHEGGGYIAPYLDRSPQSLTDNGTCLTIDPVGEIDASTYSGILNGGQCCSGCDCQIDDDEEYYSEHSDGPYCWGCYSERWTHCQECGCETDFDSMSSYQTLTRSSADEFTVDCCDSCRDIDATQTDISGEYWHNDHVFETVDGHVISVRDYDDCGYFTSEWSGDIYPDDNMIETSKGEFVDKSELSDDWQEIDGIWHDMQLKLELESVA